MLKSKAAMSKAAYEKAAELAAKARSFARNHLVAMDESGKKTLDFSALDELMKMQAEIREARGVSKAARDSLVRSVEHEYKGVFKDPRMPLKPRGVRKPEMVRGMDADVKMPWKLPRS